MSPRARTSGPHRRRQISIPASEIRVATITITAFCNVVFTEDVFGLARVSALVMEKTVSEKGQDRGEQLRALGDDKKDDEYRDHDRYGHDPVAPAFPQEMEKVVCCQADPSARFHLSVR